MMNAKVKKMTQNVGQKKRITDEKFREKMSHRKSTKEKLRSNKSRSKE